MKLGQLFTSATRHLTPAVVNIKILVKKKSLENVKYHKQQAIKNNNPASTNK